MSSIKLRSGVKSRLESHFKQAPLLWLYLLALVPTLTDLVENGTWPKTPREWITELVGGVVIFMLVHRIREEHIQVLALTRLDALTGLWNRRAFDEVIADECTRQKRSRRPLSLVFIDLDNFKRINDSAGHDAGDRVLLQLAQATSEMIRSHVDRGFRLGGDEFAVLLPNGGATQARALLARILARCQELDPLWNTGVLGISAGVVEYQPSESVESFIKRADSAMYGEKLSRKSDTSARAVAG